MRLLNDALAACSAMREDRDALLEALQWTYHRWVQDLPLDSLFESKVRPLLEKKR